MLELWLLEMVALSSLRLMVMELFLTRKVLVLLLFEELELFLLVIESEIIKELGGGFEGVEDVEHLLTDFREDFLAVTALTSWLVLIERVFEVDELEVWDVLYLKPLDLDRARPLS